MAASAAPSVNAGSTRWRHDPVPDTGSQPNFTAKIIARSGPSQKLGIAMPADPRVGDRYQMELAPGIAEDEGRVVGSGSVTVPVGSFSETIRVRESNPLDGDKGYKVYAHGVGLIVDGSVELVDY